METETTVNTETVEATEQAVEAASVEDAGLGEQAVELTETAKETEQGLESEAEQVEEEPTALGAPEGDYTLEGVELPEGMTVDAQIAMELGTVCRDLNLSQDAYGKIAAKMAPAIAARQAARLEEVKQEFLAQGRADRDMGGARWATTKAEASKAYVKFVDPETRAFLKQTGLDCHPGIIRAFHNVQKAVADDTVVRGQASSGKADPAKAFFYNSNMN